MRNRVGIVGWTSLALVAAMLFLTACRPGATATGPSAASPGYETLDSGSILGTGPVKPLAMVITSESELNQLLDLFPEGSSPPEIDTARLDGNSAIVAIFGGLQGSSGYTVALQEIEVEGDDVVLKATIAGPPAGQLVAPAEQIPYSLAVVDRSALPAKVGDVVLELQEGSAPPAEARSTMPLEKESPTPPQKESPSPLPKKSPSPASPSAYETLASGSILGSAPLEPLAVVVTQESDLDQLYGVFPRGASLPEIDAARLEGGGAIVAVFGGLRGSSGYVLAVNDVQVTGGQVVVKATITRPPADRLVEPAEQIPYVVVIVEEVVFPAQVDDVVLELEEG